MLILSAMINMFINLLTVLQHMYLLISNYSAKENVRRDSVLVIAQDCVLCITFF